MIGWLKGNLISIEEEAVLVESQGVGYEVLIPHREAVSLVSKIHSEVVFYIYTHVREDALVLYGFNSNWEKKFFTQLLKVSGVGPKMALAMLSSATAQDIFSWILQKNITQLKALPKVGQKLAEQLILGLQSTLAKMPAPEGAAVGTLSINSVKDDVGSALLNLGFKTLEIQEAIQKLTPEMSFEEAMKLSLRELRGKEQYG
jgi:Holliday junction DNA helicase RuvA